MKKLTHKTIVHSLAFCAALLLCNCDSVTTTYPLTTEPKAIDKEKFEGTWLTDDEGGVLQVKFADNGIAHIAGVEWKDDHFEIGKMEMTIVEGKEHNFISIRGQEDHGWPDQYFFLPYKFSDQGYLILWLPDSDSFKKAIGEKLLKGTIKKGKYSTEINITSDAAELIKVINDPDNSQLFNYKNPMILRKPARAGKK